MAQDRITLDQIVHQQGWGLANENAVMHSWLAKIRRKSNLKSLL